MLGKNPNLADMVNSMSNDTLNKFNTTGSHKNFQFVIQNSKGVPQKMTGQTMRNTEVRLGNINVKNKNFNL